MLHPAFLISRVSALWGLRVSWLLGPGRWDGPSGTTAAAVAADPATLATSTVFSTLIGGNNVIAYCFAEVAAYSSIGNYVGNGSADGPFIFTGFRPAWLLLKRADSTSSWSLIDTKRSPYNVSDENLWADITDAEGTSSAYSLDILSNGFKLRDGTSNSQNISSGTFIYMAFAESPFKYSNAR